MEPRLDVARAHFPRMPGEVFDLWLKEAISDRGWPFLSGTEPTMGTPWGPFFAEQRLSFWTSLSWRRESALYDDIVWGGDALDKANALVTEVVTGRAMFDVPVENSHARHQACVEFISAHRKLPAPLVCVVGSNSSWYVVDGHHRLAALISTVPPDELDNFQIEAWLGEAVYAP